MTKNNNIAAFGLVGTVGFTIMALINKEITVFYMLYLFWWQALIEIFAKMIREYRITRSFSKAYALGRPIFPIMAGYWIFIVVLFGFAFSFSNYDLFAINAEVLMFRNLPFVLNIGLTIILVAINSRSSSVDNEINFGVFSPKMVILHISIILGAFIHFGVKHYYPESFENSIYPYLFSAIPFLLLRTYFDYKMLGDE